MSVLPNWGSRADDVVVSPGDVAKEGWLLKQSKVLKEWRRRWFVLTSTHLLSFKGPGSYSNPTEVIRLQDCSTIRSAESEARNENGFRVDTPERVFLLIADSFDEKESWLGSVGRKMVRPTVVCDYPDD
eukprot:GDKH01005713.1.p1 GENE.GDKH01005713.1~~GDKH01005713.1.p1  ORF type:complete len:129 (+),score=13.95 GDKH01005713.1:168-554(+)